MKYVMIPILLLFVVTTALGGGIQLEGHGLMNQKDKAKLILNPFYGGLYYLTVNGTQVTLKIPNVQCYDGDYAASKGIITGWSIKNISRKAHPTEHRHYGWGGDIFETVVTMNCGEDCIAEVEIGDSGLELVIKRKQ